MPDYTLDITPAQESITTKLEELGYTVVEEGLHDAAPPPGGLYPGGAIKPFICVWYSPVRRTRRGRGTSLINYRLDSHTAGFDVVVVAHEGKLARTILNEVTDLMLGFKPTGGGGIYKGNAGFEGFITVLDANNRPSRWASTDRFEFVPFAQKIEPSV